MALSRFGLIPFLLLAALPMHFARAADDALGARMVEAANDFLKTLEPDELEKVALPFDSPLRTEWRITPKTDHKGLPLKNMTGAQKMSALNLVWMGVSRPGQESIETVMHFETVSDFLEKVRSKQFRDKEWYFVNIYGKPGEGRWGYSFEGHHVSMNFTLDGDKIISSTPEAFGLSPVYFRGTVSGYKLDADNFIYRIDRMGLELATSFSAEQKAIAVVAAKPAKELRDHGSRQAPVDPAQGIEFSQLDGSQKSKVKELLNEFNKITNDEVSIRRMAEIEAAGWDNVRVAWRGGTESGEHHSFCIQGPTVYFELMNAQSDPVGNVANHAHAVYRDPRGDFGLPVETK
jgi:hypothetical protein